MAHWIHYRETQRFKENWNCSECDKELTENPIFFNLETGRNLCFNFCPFCGVKMDLEAGKPFIEEYIGPYPDYAGRVL